MVEYYCKKCNQRISDPEFDHCECHEPELEERETPALLSKQQMSKIKGGRAQAAAEIRQNQYDSMHPGGSRGSVSSSHLGNKIDPHYQG